MNLKKIPHIDRLHAFPAGGQRNPIVAAKLKREGAPKGMLDVSWPYPRGEFFGFYYELKVQYRNPETKRLYKNKLSDEQSDWINYFRSQGYYAGWCYGWETLRDEIIKYNNLGESHYMRFPQENSIIIPETYPVETLEKRLKKTSNRNYKILAALMAETSPINTTLLSTLTEIKITQIHSPLNKLIASEYVVETLDPTLKRKKYSINEKGRIFYSQLERTIAWQVPK